MTLIRKKGLGRVSGTVLGALGKLKSQTDPRKGKQRRKLI